MYNIGKTKTVFPILFKLYKKSIIDGKTGKSKKVIKGEQ